jgi:hypothetical protein
MPGVSLDVLTTSKVPEEQEEVRGKRKVDFESRLTRQTVPTFMTAPAPSALEMVAVLGF